MHASNQRWRALDVRSWHVAAALIALVIIVALGSALGKVGLPPAAPTAQFGQVPGEGMLMADESLVEAPAADGQGALEMRLSAADDAGAKAADAIGRVDDALIVRTASLELEVEDVAAVLGVARREMAALGGYVSGSDEYDQGEHRWASVTYRVPVDHFDAAIEALRGLSDRVVRESTQASEVTATVVDLDARIANLRASEEALMEIMGRSGRIEDVLSVQSRLESVRGQIEQLEAQRKHLANQAALSTITVSWFTPVAAVTVAQQGWELAGEVDAALAQTVAALQSLASLGIWLAVVAVPLLGIPLLVVVLLVALLRRSRRHSQGLTSAS